MLLKRFDNIAEFYPLVEPFLLAHEAEHNLILGLCTILLKTDTFQHPPYLAYVECDGDIVAVALRTPPYNLILSHMADKEPLSVIADDVGLVYDKLLGVIGAKHTSKAFAHLWKGRTGQDYRLKMQERIYCLEQVNPVSGVRGDYRPATEADRALLTDWFMAFSAEAVEVIAHEEAERLVNLRFTAEPSLRGLRLWCDGGKPVSFSGYTGPTPHGIRVGPVYTPPEYRGRGYASACVAALSQELLDAGRQFVFLFADLSNPTSNHIYKNIGYQPVCDVDEYRFEGQSLEEQG